MTTAPEPGPAPAFRFQVQPEFHEIPLGLGADTAAHDEQLRQFARDYWGEAEELEPLRRMMAVLYGVTAEDLTAGGGVYQALGIFPIGGTADGVEPPERYSRATLTVSVRELANPDPYISAAGIAELLDKSAESGEVQPIVLPVGPAVVHIAGTRAVWDLPAQPAEPDAATGPATSVSPVGTTGAADSADTAGPADAASAAGPADAAGPAGIASTAGTAVTAGPAGSPSPAEQERFFVRIEVWLPFPDEDRLLLLCLSTPDTQDLFHYQAVLADIADTIAFGEQVPVPDDAESVPAASPLAAY
ncbi:hypothetical protein [Streptomyces sp. NPDC016845]|uniref:hypothetical protein n=1 Tax=Streptomyces sp. NPDC016845 TaxID=3364972 RepID=UPI003795E867